MAKILTFLGKEERSSDLDFLADENQTLAFRTPEDGSTVSLGQIRQACAFPDPKKDWSNQELADLFKVRQLLSGANVVVETDRGVTDEGDPWFVFCHGSGEVFIHLCRIDGLYLLDSPNVLRPLRGANFEELISDFTNQALPAADARDSDTERRVIRLERGGKVRLHPSAMLAALIWTLFLASEELVMMAPEDGADSAGEDDSLLNFEGIFAVEGGEQVLTGGLFEDEVTMVTTQPKDIDEDVTVFVPETQGQIREAALHQQGLTAQHNCFSIGLSTIAIAMGFMSEAVLLDNQRKVMEQLKQLGFAEYGKDTEAPIEVHIADTEGDVTLLTMLADFLGIELSEDTEFAQADAATPKEASLLQQEIADSIDTTLTVNEALPSAKAAQAAVLKNEKIDDAEEVPADLNTRPAKTIDTVTASKAETTTSQTADGTETDALTLSDVVKDVQLGQLTTVSSFDLTATDTSFALFKAGAEEPTRVVDLYEFDGLAERLSDFFSSRGSELGFIEQSYGFIAIDRDAVRSGEDVEYIEWRTDNGKVISVIGLQSDFEYFDMIA